MVYKQASAFISKAFLSKCMQDATLDGREKAVCRNTVARMEMIFLECLIIWQRLRSHVGRRSCVGLYKKTCVHFKPETLQLGAQPFAAMNGPECSAAMV
jgi:hypothetical protein